MRELVTGPRQSGRTTTLLLTMIEEMDMHDKDVYLIVSGMTTGALCRHLLKKYNADMSRIKLVTLGGLHTMRGVNPMDIYIEHTAYEFSDTAQLRTLYELEDRKHQYIYGH